MERGMKAATRENIFANHLKISQTTYIICTSVFGWLLVKCSNVIVQMQLNFERQLKLNVSDRIVYAINSSSAK